MDLQQTIIEPYRRAVFVMDNGEHISVIHQGEYLQVRSEGRAGATGLSVAPVASNLIKVKAEE